jgi:hypothetical protein
MKLSVIAHDKSNEDCAARVVCAQCGLADGIHEVDCKPPKSDGCRLLAAHERFMNTVEGTPDADAAWKALTAALCNK